MRVCSEVKVHVCYLSKLTLFAWLLMASINYSDMVILLFCFLQDIQTNVKGKYTMGEYNDKELIVEVKKGERVGNFSLGSTIVLIFEAPENFRFLIGPGQTVKFGQPLGTF